MNRSLILGARGLARPEWLAEFYPPDLPEDWRMPYYANEFGALLLPAADWAGLDLDTAAAWVDGVPPDFRFVLELAGASSWPPDALSSIFGDRLAGLLCRDAPPAGPSPRVPCLRPEARRGALDLWRTEDGSLAVGIVTGQPSRPTPLELRRAIEALVEAGGERPSCLFVDGSPALLHDLRTLAGLLGFDA